MNADTATKVRHTGLVRSPEREGALAHFDPDRGFALVARASMGLTDVIDPTIWVREKLALALGLPADAAEAPLKRALAALRSIHSELMARGEGERQWVSVLLALFQEADAVAVLAGDCACYRFREGYLARLGRHGEATGGRAPAGALGTETQVRIEVVPLRPQAGDCYILSTEPLGEGELARLSRELESARGEGAVLRHAMDGSPDKGRVAIVVHRGGLSLAEAVEPEAESLTGLGVGEVDAALAPLSLEPLDAGLRRASSGGAVSLEPSPGESIPGPAAPPMPVAPAPQEDALPAASEREFGESDGAVLEAASASVAAEPDAAVEPIEPAATRHRRGLATLEEGRPWYEPLALWGAGALAIVALAILIRSIVPGILGDSRDRTPRLAAPSAQAGSIDVYSEPPGAAIRVDGVPIEQKTPATGLSLEPGVHRIELDWGPYGAWSDTIEVVTGERLTIRPKVTGRATFRSSDPARLLDVYLDGSYAGSTPLVLDELPLGRHLVRFGAPGTDASAQEFELFRETPLELVGNAGAAPQPGSITARTALLGDEGFQSGKGDPVWVDGELKGVTPITVPLRPGAHSVRVVRRGFPAQVSVIEVKPGGEHFSTAEFGARSGEPLVCAAPLSLSLSDPAPLTITLPESEWNDSPTVWLYAAPPGGSFIARRMTPLEGREHAFAGLVPPEVLRNAVKKVRVYFRAVGPAGQEIHSEIQTIPVKE
jgi:hypothetical protein